jgi:hypothetical protein
MVLSMRPVSSHHAAPRSRILRIGSPKLLVSRALSTAAQTSVPEGSAYAVLGVPRNVGSEQLKAQYKELAKTWHPDRHQGEGRADAEKRFQEITEAYQTLSDITKRGTYDSQLDAAQTAAEVKAAAQRFRAQSWNSEIPDVQARLRKAKREEAGFPPHIIAGTLVLVTGNFVLMLNWLGG